MSLRTTILIMSGLGVMSDAILIAFYPQFFKLRYGIDSPVHAGNYIAAISIAVMCALPFWAKVARKVETMPLLFVTQGIAGGLGIASAFAPNVQSFWVISMIMYVIKASYLLMFPYLMRLEKPEHHSHLVGLLSVIIHITAIFAATLGGLSLQSFGPQQCVFLMAAGDFLQMALCYYLIKSNKVVPKATYISGNSSQAPNGSAKLPRKKRSHILGTNLAKLSLVMMLFDFSAYVIRPFFSTYWEDTTGILQRGITGVVFAIPALAALIGLYANRLASQGKLPKLDHPFINLTLGAIGLTMQAMPHIEAILIGRFLFGWGMFQIIVNLEVTLFQISTPDNYARDFSVANFFQNLGVLLSSFSAGYIVSLVGAQQTFFVAALGFLCTAVINQYWFSSRKHSVTGDSTHVA